MKTINPYAAPGIPYFSNLTATTILKKVSDFYGHDISAKPKTRKRAVVFPRQVASYLLKKEAKLTLSDIARLLNQTHCNVYSSIKLIENQLETNKDFRKEFNELIIKLK